MLLMPHVLDPNVIDFGEDHEHRVYGDDYENVFAVVDADDYWHFSQWRWKVHVNKSGKLYLVRNTNRGSSKTTPSFTMFLHVEIHKRTGIPRPDQFHTMVDHRNGDSLFCCKHNVRWATPSMNRRNLWGQRDLL